MTNIELLKERIEKTNVLLGASLKGGGSVDNNYIAVILLDIMQALAELLEKADADPAEETAEDIWGSAIRDIFQGQQNIGTRLHRIEEKLDRPVTFNLPTEHPDIVQHVVAEPGICQHVVAHPVPGPSQPTIIPDNPTQPPQSPDRLPPNQS